MTKFLHNQTYKSAVIFMVALLVLPISLSAGAKALRLSDSRNIENDLVVVNRNTFFFSSIEGQINALPDDTTAVVCPEDISTYTDLNSCDALITSGLSIEDPDNVITSLTWIMEGATTGQSPASGVNQISSSVFNEGTTIITYQGSTRTNNPINCTFTVTVSDNQVPKLIYGPGNTTVSNSSNECYAQVRWTEPIVSDNCVAEDNIIIQSSHTSGETFPVGVTEVEYRISDGINELIHRFTVTVKDDVAPTLTAPEPMTVVCGEEIEDAFTSWNQFQQAGGKVTDNCAINYSSFRYVSQAASGIRCPYTITRTYSIEDVNGNVSEVKRYIQVTGEEEEIIEEQQESVVGLKSGMAVITSTGTGGDWNNGLTWVGGIVPQPTDDVVIATGATVTISGNQSCDNITINGTLEISGTNTLQVNGSWTNNGSFNAGTYGTVSFNGSGTNSIGGSSSTVFKNFVINTGSVTDILNVNSDIVFDGDVTFASGLLQIPSGSDVTCTGNTGFTIEQNAGIFVDGGTFTSGAFSIENNGLFRIDSGSATLGSNSGNSIVVRSNGTFDINGGTIDIAGRLEVSGGAADISGGIINLNSVGHNSSSIATLDLSLASDFNMTAGTINFLNPNGTGYYDIEIENGTGGNKSISGGTFNFGDGSVDTYRILTDTDMSGATTTTANNTELEITQNVSSNGTYTFDLSDGNGNIIPVTITISASSYGSNASIVVTTTDGKQGDNASSTHFLSRYWTITLSDISGASYSVTAEYPQGDVNSGGQESEIAAGVWTGSLPWIKGNVANGGANTISISGLTSSVELTGITLDAPTVIAGATNTEICNGENINLTASGSGDPTLTYSWTGPNSFTSAVQNPTINNATTAAAGTYTVTVTDGNGFTASDNVAITVNPTPDVTATPAAQTICSGTQTSISLSGTIAGTTYSWTVSPSGVSGAGGGSGTSIAQNLTATGTSPGTVTYTITPTANGCDGTPEDVIVTVNPTPTVTNPGNQTLCSGENTATISFFGSVSGTVYSWTNDNTSIGLAATGNGDITAFTATNSGSAPEVASITVTPEYTNNGVTCTGSTEIFTITVNPLPTATAGSNSPECEGEIINLTASGGVSYSWTGPNGFISNQQNPSISNVYSVHDGDYTVTVTDANGCEATATTSVVIYPKPTVKITIDDNSTICEGTEVTFTTTVTGAGTNPTFDWQINGISTGETGTSYTSSTLANTDVVRVIMTADPNHCSSVITSNSYVMTVNPTVVPSVNVNYSNDDICAGETVDFEAVTFNQGTAPTYQWQIFSGGTWQDISGATSKTYSTSTLADGDEIRVFMTSNANCASPTDVVSSPVAFTVSPVVVPAVSIIANETTICPGDLIQFSVDTETNQGSNPSYQWKVNGVNVGTDLPTYSTSSLVNGDEVTLEMTSNARCASPTIATSNLISIVVNPGTPAIPGAITGNTAVCPSTIETYTIASVTDASDYTWSVPGDWTIQSGQGTTTITVITGATGTNKNVSVTVGNSCGTSSPRTLNTTVGSESVDPTGISNPNNNTCEGTSKVLTVQGGSLGTGAQWVWYTGSCGGTQIGTGISITVNPSPGTYTYYVWAEGTCDTTACISVDVTVSPGAPVQPAAISGLTPVCPGESFTYYISPVEDADPNSYAWSVPGGWTITAGQGDTLITVTSGSAGQNGNISVTASNSCGTSTAQIMAVTVAAGEPATPGTIAGENDQCLNSSGLVYSISNVTNATSYNWTLPSGWTITSGSGTNSITVSTNGAAVSGTIEVTAENSCGESAASVLPVNIVSSEPADVGPINGQTAICPTVTAVYTVPDIGAVDYFWEVPSGWIIESGQGTPTLSVEIPMAGQSGDIIVTASNVCGPSDPDTLNVTVANDATVEAGPDQVVCEGSTWVYLAGQTGGAIDRHQEWDWVSVTPGGTFVDDRDLGTIYNFPSGFTTGEIYVAITSTESVGGCAYPTDTMKITVMPYPTASIASTDTVCNGEDAVVTITATPNTTVQYRIGLAVPTTVNIDGSGEATISLPALTTTTDFRLMNVRYTALATCQMTTDYTVQVVVKDLAEVFAGDDQSLCVSEPDVYLAGTITGDVTSGSWTGGSGTFTPNASTLDAVYSPTESEIAAGTLTLTLTSDDPSGPCGTSYDEVTITFDQAATVNAGSDQDICADGSATLAGTVGGAVTSGVWTGGTGTFSPNANTLNASYTPSASEISAGTVQLILSTDDPSGVCSLVSDTVVITIFPVATVDAGVAQTICATSVVNLSATIGGAATYGTWTGGNGSFAPNDTSLTAVYTPSADEISDGSVTLTLTTDDPNGPCNQVSDQVTITIDEAPTVNAGIDDRVCEGSTIILAGSIGGSASSATWSAAAGSFSDVNALNAVYTHANGYSGPIALVLTTDDPSGTCGAVSDTMILTIDTTISVTAGNDTMICSDATITLDGWVESGTGTWSTNGSGSFNNVNDANAVYTPSSGDIFNEVVTLTFTTEDPGGDCGPASDNLILTIKEVIEITTEPKNTGACATDTAELFVEAVGDNLTYQWYRDDGTPVSNTAVINGAQSSILQFTNATSANMDGYYVVITSPNACDTAVSTTATLNVDEEIIVTTPLVSDSVCEGEDVTFSIVAEPGGFLAYQWRRNGVDLADGANVSGVNTSTLTLTNVTANEAGAYSVFLSGLAGYTCDDAQSAPGNLFVIPDATLSPSNQSETFCLDTPIDTITYTFNEGVEDVLVTTGSLPPGLNTSFDAAAKRFMIHGVPTVSGTYNFTLTTDGFCAPASATGTIIILDEFVAPVINGSQTICYNSAPTAFGMSSPPTGGSGVYSYQWQDSIPGSSWDTISGANVDTYNSPDLIETTYFRLVVTDIGDPSCGGGVSNAIAPGVSNVIEVIPFDTVPPKFTVPDEYTLTADANCAANTNPVITGEPIIVNGDICSSDAFLRDHATYYDHDTIPGSCGSSYSFTRTWVVTDEAGNVTEKDQTINIEDRTAPTLTAPVGFPISCDQDTTPAALGQATAVDNCDSDPLVTYYDVITPGFCAGEYTISRHWVATDACGNADTLIRSYDVTDNVDPVVVNTGDTIVQCVGDIPHPDASVFEYYDFCGTASIELVDEIAHDLDTESGYCPYQVVRTWRVTDDCNNWVEFDQTISVQQDASCPVCSECVYNNTLYVADFRNQPYEDTTFYDVVKRDKCCGAENEPGAQNLFCASFKVRLDDGAVGVEILIDKVTPPGQDWQLDCEVIDGGSVVCLPSGEFHLFTFCKHAQSSQPQENDYTFRQVRGVIASGDIETREECDEVLSVTGEFSNPRWTSVFPGPDGVNPGASGAWDHLLSSTTDTIVYFNAEPGSPSHIQYAVCGDVTATLCATTTGGVICDTVDVYVRPAIEMDLNINPDLICEDYIPEVSPIISPAGAYDLEWYIGATPSGTPVSYEDSYTPPATGWYSVVAIDNATGLDCNRDTFNFEMKYDLTGPTIKDVPPPLYLECNTSNYATLIGDWLAIPQAEYVDEYGDTVSTTVHNDYGTGSGPVTMICGDTVLVTFSAADQCSNDTLAYSYIYVTDTTSPEITPAQDSTIQCSTTDPNQDPGFLSWLANHGGATASDICDPDLVWSADTASTTWTGDPANNQRTVTFTVTDDCGNEAQTTATFSIIDTVPPDLTCPPNVEEVASPDLCSKVPDTLEDPIYSDECSDPVLSWSSTGALDSVGGLGTVSAVAFPVGVTTVTYVATDNAGLTAECSFTVTIVDTVPPSLEISGCQNVTETFGADDCTVNPTTIPDPDYSDNCWPTDSLVLTYVITGATEDAGSGSVSGHEFNVGVSTVEYTVVDPDGNEASCSFTVTILRADIPYTVITCPGDPAPVTVTAGACDAQVSVDPPTIDENCPTATYTITNNYNNDTAIVNETFPVGTTEVIWTITDNSGNDTTCIVYVRVSGTNDPSITCPTDVTGTMTADECEAIPPTIGSPVYSAPCWPNDSLDLTFTIVTEGGLWDTTGVGEVNGIEFPVGASVVTYRVTDPDSNYVECSFTVTMLQDDIPYTVITCPSDPAPVTVTAGACDAQVSVDRPTINEHCETAIYTITNDYNNDTVIVNETFPVGTTEVIWTISDNSGNDTTCIVYVRVSGTNDPSITCPSGVTGTMTADECEAIPPTIGSPAYSAPCWPNDSLDLTFTIVTEGGLWDTTGVGEVNGIEFPVGASVVTYRVTDPDSNYVECSFTVTMLQDDIPYTVITCPSDPAPVTVTAGACDAQVSVDRPTINEHCETAIYTITNDYNNDTAIVNETFPVGTTEVIWTISDNSGNDTTCIVYVRVSGTNDPSITCPTDVTGTMTADECEAIPPSIGIPDVEAPCWPDDSLIISYSITSEFGGWDTTGTGIIPSDLEFPVGTNTVWYIVTDPDGNKDSCDFTVTMLQDDIPYTVITCPSDPAPVTVAAGDCDAQVSVDRPTINEHCETATYTITNDFNNDTAIVNETFPVGTTEVNWTISDNSGNDTICTVYVRVSGTNDPSITCPPSVTGTMTADLCEAVPPTIGSPTYSAPCWPSDSLIISYSITSEFGNWDTTGTGLIPSDLEFPVGTNTVWYIVADPDGNKDSCDFTVTMLQDEIPSTVYTCPVNPADATVDSFSCDAWVDIDPPTINDHCVTASYSINHNSIYAAGTDSTDASGYYPIGEHTITWTITDNSGNDTTCTQTFEVFDLLPELTCPPDVEVFADENELFATGVTVGLPYYWDNCDSILTYTVTTPDTVTTLYNGSPDSINLLDYADTYDLGVTTIEYTFKDGHGNVVVCDFTVTVFAAPDIECPPDTTIYLDGSEADCSVTFDPGVADLIEGAPPITWTYTIHFADGTTEGPVQYTKDASDPYADPLGDRTFPLGVTTIEWRAENDAGYDTCSHWIEVIDTIPPTLTADPYENCVDPLHWVVYNEDNPNPKYNHVDPNLEKFPVDYRTMFAGDTILDLTSLEDNCCDSTEMTINWRIEFSDTPDPVTGAAVSHPDITGTGQPSAYEEGGIPTDIYLWGDGVTFTAVTHQIFYWAEDCNGNTSEEIRAEITITPRPEVKKAEY